MPITPNTRGLGALASVSGGPSNSSGGGGISALLGILQSHPGASMQLKQSILSSVMGSLGAAQQQRQANYQNALQSTESYALSPNATPEGLQAYMNLAGSGLGPNQQARLGAQAPDLGALMPTQAGVMSDQGRANLAAVLDPLMPKDEMGKPKSEPGLLEKLQNAAANATRAMGGAADDVKMAVEFATQFYSDSLGLGYTPPAGGIGGLIQTPTATSNWFIRPHDPTTGYLEHFKP